jgi:hypothetical protein
VSWFKSLNEALKGQAWTRGLAIATGVLLVSGIASIGAVGPDTKRIATGPETAAVPAAGGETVAPSPTEAADAGATGTGRRSSRGTSGSGAGGGKLDFGLRTQGVTSKEVKVGFSYNQASCGDNAFLEAFFGAATVGDFEKSINTFARHVNDNGGVGGRTYKPQFFDDGGSGCPEKNVAAAVQMANEANVFLGVPGLDVAADYLIAQKVPTWGGRDLPDSMAKYGPNGLHILQPHDPNLEAWASFGKHFLKSGSTPEVDLPCLIRIESGASGNWDIPEAILVSKMKKYGLEFGDIIVFKDDASTATTQSEAITTRADEKGCQHIYFMAGNPVGLVFMTSAASKRTGWFPKWTFTSRTALTDDDNIGKLMNQSQWENAIGLTIRVPAGEHRFSGNCKRIYEKYNPNDGQSNSVAVTLACVSVLPTAEMMNRGIKRTGNLDSNAFLLGADSIRNDFYYDATVPMEFKFPSPGGPFKTKGFSHWTVADWSSAESRYTFPAYPCFYRTFGPNNAGCEDLRSTYK